MWLTWKPPRKKDLQTIYIYCIDNVYSLLFRVGMYYRQPFITSLVLCFCILGTAQALPFSKQFEKLKQASQQDTEHSKHLVKDIDQSLVTIKTSLSMERYNEALNQIQQHTRIAPA